MEGGQTAQSLKAAVALTDKLSKQIDELGKATAKAEGIAGVDKAGAAYRDKVIPAMNALRETADALEDIVDACLWPLPTYAEMLFLK